MKGCYGITVHYLRVLCLFVAPLLLWGAGMASMGQVRVGNLTLEGVNVWQLGGLGFLCWIIVAARVMRKGK